MKVVKKLGMAALGCLCVGLSIGNINTAHAGKGINEDPTGKAYKEVKGDSSLKALSRFFNMKQAIRTKHWEKVEEYTDPVRTKNYKKAFLEGGYYAAELLVLAFDKAVESESTDSMNILLRLLDTTVCYYKNYDVCLAKHAKIESSNKERDVSGSLWRALCDLDEDNAIKIVQTLGKHDVKCDNVVDTKGYGKVSILDVSLLNGRTKLYKALLESGVNEFHVKEVMDSYVKKLFGINSADKKTYMDRRAELEKKYEFWFNEYGKTVDNKTYYSNVTGFIKTKGAEHEKKKQEELARRKAKEQEELAKKQKEQLQKSLDSAWENAFKAGDIAKIREIRDRGYKPYYAMYGELTVITDQFLKNLVICEYKGEPHKSAEEALGFLEQLVNEKLTTWNKIFWNIGRLDLSLNKEECVEESEILCKIAKGIKERGGKVNNVVDGWTPMVAAALNYRVCPVRALLAAGSDRNPRCGAQMRVCDEINDTIKWAKGKNMSVARYTNMLAVLEEDRG